MDNRPKWDEYFMALAFVCSQRSLDPDTKHGCVIVDKDKRIISLGFNSPPKGCIDEQIPKNRPDKYPFFLHSEENALLFAQKSTDGCTAYITGEPCSVCLRMMLQKGISRIVYGPVKSKCVDNQDTKIKEIMLKGHDISLEYMPVDNQISVIKLLNNTIGYIDSKTFGDKK